jgi:uncharacterized protein
MPNRLSHFSIPCADVERAKRFYEAVFQWRIEPWGPPGYYQILPDYPDRSVTGDLHERPAASRDGRWGFECTFGVADLKPVVEAVAANGGRMDMPEFRIDGVGNLIYFIDTEGNRVGAMRYDSGCG